MSKPPLYLFMRDWWQLKNLWHQLSSSIFASTSIRPHSISSRLYSIAKFVAKPLNWSLKICSTQRSSNLLQLRVKSSQHKQVYLSLQLGLKSLKILTPPKVKQKLKTKRRVIRSKSKRLRILRLTSDTNLELMSIWNRSNLATSTQSSRSAKLSPKFLLK